MKFTDLSPRWYALIAGGPRVGLTFDCPHCRTQRLGVLFHHQGREALEDAVILAEGGKGHIWTMVGPDDFANLTLTPSIDASSSGHWHGYVTSGNVSP